MRNDLISKLNNRKGVTAIEFALLLAVLVVGAVSIFMALTQGPKMQAKYEQSAQTQEQAQESLVEQIRDASLEKRSALMKGADADSLKEVGMKQVGFVDPGKISEPVGPKVIWIDEDENFYIIRFLSGKVENVRGPFVELVPSASSETESGSPSTEPEKEE